MASSSLTLEPAIPEHLQKPRTIPLRGNPDYSPPVPAYSARFPLETKHLVMAIIGVQTRPTIENPSPHYTTSSSSFQEILTFIEKPLVEKQYEPQYWESASMTDPRDAFNQTAIAYWRTRGDYEGWSRESGFATWWESLTPGGGGGEKGWFLEVLFPSIDRFETVFSDDKEPEGAAYMRCGVSGPIREHVYVRAMRIHL